MYPVFVVQKAFVGTLTITTTFGDTAESQAVAFVKVETSRGTYSIILFRGKTYTISKLEENSTVTISVTSTINHKATASQTSITITQQSNSVSILVEKVGVGTFYAGTELSYTVQQEVLSTQAVSEPIVQDTIEEIVEIETEEELAEQTCEEDNEHSDNTEIDSCSNDVFDLAYEQKKYIMFRNKKEQKLYL